MVTMCQNKKSIGGEILREENISFIELFTETQYKSFMYIVAVGYPYSS